MDARLAADYARKQAGLTSSRRCAEFTRRAIAYGGIELVRHNSAKDYGASLKAAGFYEAAFPYCIGDVAVVQPIQGHPHGHMAIFDGLRSISDFVQRGDEPYPGPLYREVRPLYTIYRHD